MRRFYTLLLTMSMTTIATHATTKTLTHTIKNGDSLYKIALKNHLTVDELKRANKIKTNEKLKLGRVLSIPSKATPKKEKSLTKVDTAKKNNVKKQIASKKEVKQKKKSLSKNSSIKQTIKADYYTIQKGDTLFSIAKKHHATVENIRALNEIKSSQSLKLGKTLKMPHTEQSKELLVSVPVKKQELPEVEVKKSIASKKILTSIEKLDTILLEKTQVKKDKKSTLFSLLFDSEKSHTNKTDKFITQQKCVKITSLAKKKLGKRYVWGATGTRNTFDCSGLTTYVYNQNGIKLPRRAIAQSKIGKRISKKELRKGDLVFFDTSKRKRGYVNHVGIYIGDNKFIHASSAKHRVVISSLNEPFYRSRLTVARRLES